MIKLRHAFAFAAAATLAAPASAQNLHLRRPSPGALAEGEILVQANRSIAVKLEEGADVPRQQDDAARLIYRMAERECALVLETIGASCELASVSTNVTSNEEMSGRGPMIRATGSYSLKVRLKS